MKVKLILFLCSLILVGISCKKHKDYVYIQNNLKEWANFNKGSYWIYLNENSQKLDSMYISITPENYFYSPYNETTTGYERIKCHIVYLGEFDLIAETDNSYLYYEGIAGHSYIISSKVIDNLTDQVSPSCRVINRYDTLLLNNYKFVDVIHTRDSTSSSIKDFYFARGIGLVQFSSRSGTEDINSSLVRWLVIK